MARKFVAVAGNIGAGKSSLVEKLCQALGWQPFYEPEATNPYLADFYRDMPAWAFHSQLYFLTHRLRCQRDLANLPDSVIQDRTIFEDAEVFARNLYLQGYINERDFATYRDLYQSITLYLAPPDLVVFLRASVPTLLERIARRQRGYEAGITAEYLGQLNRLYDEWIAGFTLCPVLTIPADSLDFVSNAAHLDLIVRKVQEKLAGKEIVTFDQT